MLSVFSITLPFFALVLLGYLATQRGLLPLTAISGLNAFVLFFALPCMLFRFGASTPISQLLDMSVFMVYLPCALFMVGLAMLLARRRKTNWNNASMGALVAAFPNTGFMGIPMLVALLGAKVAGPAIITITIDMVMTTSLCVALSRLDAAGEHGAIVAFKKALIGMISNPMPWAILLGTTTSALNLSLWEPMGRVVALLGNAASPVALFTIGAVLARSRLTPKQKETSSHDYWLIALLKLFLHPALVWTTGSVAIRLGVPLTPFALTVITLVAALPSASNVTLLSERFHADTARIAHIILISTTLAFLTFSGVVTLLI